ncbi:zinc finger BED domain-containing protein RICESLEEPER 2-like [Rhizophagus irregularis DAOM 181602=DAOM 197198]|nr:zinc finger BED domain-containing protein RICESLEEPER 2-like [Rhizophagus irregularis DAOM 181602=DAOM 197198]
MAVAITNVLNEFNLADKALALTTDNESAMLVCGRKLSKEFEKELNNLTFSHYRCSAHILNLAVKQEKLEYLQPEIDIETRWNSTYYMLCKLQRMETALKMLAAKHDSETVIVLEPLERATKNLSGSLYPTIADVRFYFNEIRDHLKYCVEKEDGFGQYASINEKLKEYWLIIDNNTTISSILNSRNKISLFEPGELMTNAIATLREQFSFYLSQKPQLQTSLPSTSSRE